VIEDIMASAQGIHRLQHPIDEVLVVAVEFCGDPTESLAVAHQGGQLEELGPEEQLEGLRLDGIHV